MEVYDDDRLPDITPFLNEYHAYLENIEAEPYWEEISIKTVSADFEEAYPVETELKLTTFIISSFEVRSGFCTADIIIKHRHLYLRLKLYMIVEQLQLLLLKAGYDDGTVVESEYYSNTTTQKHWFTFTTMTSVLDGMHPVAGNRRFGIFPDASGGYTFFFMGVDRIWDYFTSISNFVSGGYGFGAADALWSNAQTNVKNYVNAHEGTASYYSQPSWVARPAWGDPIKSFLQGKITLTQLKEALDCP